MISDRFKDWWKTQSEVEKVKLIRKRSSDLVSNQLKKQKASDAEFNFNGCRKGIRGGKITTLAARSQTNTKIYLDCIEELKFMINNL